MVLRKKKRRKEDKAQEKDANVSTQRQGHDKMKTKPP